jgi:hypothetical protein
VTRYLLFYTAAQKTFLKKKQNLGEIETKSDILGGVLGAHVDLFDEKTIG